MYKLTLQLVSIYTLLLTIGCTNGKILDDPDKLGDNGKSNTVLVEYDLSVQVLQRHPTATVIDARLCPESKSVISKRITPKSGCVVMAASYVGITDEDGQSYETYKVSGSDAYQRKYGSYSHGVLKYDVLTARVPELVCTTSKLSLIHI